MTIIAEIGESVIDVSVRVYGHATGAFWLIEDNPGIAIDHEFTAPTELIIRDQFVKLLELGPVIFQVQKLPDYTVKERQSFWDILIENQGTVEAVFDLVNVNNFDGPTEHIFVEQPIKIISPAQSPRVQEYMQSYTPIATIEEEDKADGIGFMFVEKNLKIR